MTESTALTVADTSAAGLIKTPVAKLDEFAEFMARSGPMVGPSMQGNPERCRAVAYLADRWGMDPFSVSSEVFFFTNRDRKEIMSFGAKLIVALVNSRAPLAKPLHVSYKGEGQTRQCIVTGWLVGADEPSVYTSPTVAQTRVKNSPLWTADPDQQLSYAAQRGWARRFTPQAILGVYAPEEMATVAEVQPVEPPAERAAALFDDSAQDADFEEPAAEAEPVTTSAPSLRDRVETALKTVQAVQTVADWDRAWRLTANLRIDLERASPDDLLVELEAGFQARRDDIDPPALFGKEGGSAQEAPPAAA